MRRLYRTQPDAFPKFPVGGDHHGSLLWAPRRWGQEYGEPSTGARAPAPWFWTLMAAAPIAGRAATW